MSTDTADLTAELVNHFGPEIQSDPSLLVESLSLCTRYNLSPEALFYKWSAHAFNNKLPSGEQYNLDHARELRKAISAEKNGSQHHSLHASTPLKPSAHGNLHIPKQGNVALSHILGLGTPKSHAGGVPLSHAKQSSSAAAVANNGVNLAASPFRTPSRPTHIANADDPGMTPASASAYRHSHLDMDMAMAPDFDSPSSRRSPLASGSSHSRAGGPSSSSSSSSFRILETLNSEHPLDGSGCQSGTYRAGAGDSTSSKKSRITLAVATDPRAWNYRYMFEKKGERSQVLDDRIDQFASMMREAYRLDDDMDFGDPSMPSQEPIYVVGRICPALPAPASGAGQRSRAKPSGVTNPSSHGKEAEDDEMAVDDPSGLPKLASAGLVLESSRMMGSGNRIPLFLQRGCTVRHGPLDPGTAGSATTVGLFPGQIVMLKGMNGGGERFGVSEVLMPPPLPLASSPADEMLENQYAATKLDGKALNVVVASGPYTSDEDLEFAPWHRMMDELERGGLPCSEGDGSESQPRRGVPDALILMGPFLSASHPLLPFSAELPLALFSRHIATRLNTLATRFASLLTVLIPSTLDILHPHCAYPQPGFSSASELGLTPKRIKLLPNPSVFYLNELVFAATTADVLRDLKSEELVCRIDGPPLPSDTASASATATAKTTKDLASRLGRHVVSQRTFYPLFPAPPTSSLGGLDVSHSHLLHFPAVTPDVLLLPSAVKPFVRVVESSVVINPGRVAGPAASGNAGLAAAAAAEGCIASLHVRPTQREELESGLVDQQQRGEEEANLDHKAYERARCDLLAL